jgi:transcriptional regulator with XRE-family HTH domain
MGEMFAQSRVESLRAFRARLGSLDLTRDVLFQEAFCEAQTLLELSDAELADKLLVSRPTVNRWVQGRNLPRRALRRSIVNWVDEQLAHQRLKILEQQATRPAAVDEQLAHQRLKILEQQAEGLDCRWCKYAAVLRGSICYE